MTCAAQHPDDPRLALERVQQAHDFSEALNRLNEILYAEPDMSAVLDYLVAEGGRVMGAESAVIEVLDDGELVVRHQSGAAADVHGRRMDPLHAHHLIEAADLHGPVAIDDTSASADLAFEAMEQLGVRAVLSVPLLVFGKILGFLSFNWHSRAHTWTPEQVEFASRLAVTASLGLQNLREREQLRASEKRFRSTFDLAPVGVALIAPNGRWLRVNNRLCEITGYRRKQLMELSLLDITHPEDIPEDARNRELLLGGEISSYSMEKRYVQPDGSVRWGVQCMSLVRRGDEPEYFVSMVEDIDDRKRAEEQLASSRRRENLLTRLLEDASQPFAVGRFGGELLMCNDAFVALTGFSATELNDDTAWNERLTPVEWRDVEARHLDELLTHEEPVRYTKELLRRDGTRVPVEVLAHLYRGRTRGPLIYAFITDITQRAATEEGARLSHALNDVDALITSTLEIDTVMDGMLTTAAEALGVDTAAVTLLEHDSYRITHTYGFPDEFAGTHLSREDLPYAELAVDTRVTVVIDDARNDPRTKHEVIERFGVQSAIVVPLLRADEVYGAVVFNYSEPRAPFSPAQVDFATKLGSHVSLALENAMLYEAEHRVAETLQGALLRLPDIVPGLEFAHRYHSASTIAKVGGDFYDLFELEDGEIGFIVGDVSGKGLEAAVLNARARATIRAELGVGKRSPAQVLRRVNEVLVRESDPETFFTVFLGVIDPHDGRLVYASGGHTTSALVKPGGEVDRLPSTGPIVGAFPGLEFSNGYAQMDPGDVLFAYTDGLIEARGPHDMFGESRLFAELEAHANETPQSLVTNVVDYVMDFADGLYDDVAVMAVRRKIKS
jgi:PAS domain S-box-containing protein